jgi:hypothetical protein
MNIEKFSMTKERAEKLWKEYIAACKDNPKDKFLNDMKKVYSQLKSGRKVVDINKIFENSLVNEKYEPKLAICKALAKEVYFRYGENGIILFSARNINKWESAVTDDIVISNIFPQLPQQFWEGNYDKIKRGTTIVPAIPASARPKGNLKGYYILWEVEKWAKIPPKDPYLLRRITPNMFVVVAGWNLSELERAVMRGRVY